MATRSIALGRIIEWAKTADPEEVAYMHQRIGKTLAERTTTKTPAPDMRKAQRPRKAKVVGVPTTPSADAGQYQLSQAAGE